MLRDKSRPLATKNTRSADATDPDASHSKTTRSSSGLDTGTLGAKGKKTATMLKDSRAYLSSQGAAIKWLVKEELLIEGEDITTAALSQALMWTAAGGRNTVDQLVDAIRAVALCLEGCGHGEVADNAICEIKETAALWVGEAKSIMQKAADEMIDVAKKALKDEGGKRSWADDVVEGEGNGQAAPSYAGMVRLGTGQRRVGLAQQDVDYMASEALRRRKVLIDGIEGVSSAAGGLAPAEIVAKANIALTAARLEAEGNGYEPRSDPLAVAAKVLENGGVVLELDSEEAVEWVTDQLVRKTFEANFGGSAKLVDQLHHVVVSFLPVTLRESLPDIIPKMEADNDLPEGAIAKNRWLKAPKYWKEGQRSAHAVFSFRDRTDASKAIQRGVIVAGQRFKAKKMEELPRRCFKCQRFGHMASRCKEISVICPNCAGAHAGDTCSMTTDKFRCINCSKAGKPANHAVWDWACPSLEDARKKKAAKNPDSGYRFFPTKEEWTWAKRDMFSDEEVQGVERNWSGGVRTGLEDRTTDGGWEGMRLARGRGQTGEGPDGWTTVEPRNVRGREASQRSAREAPGNAPSQRTGYAASQRGVSRPGPTASGRQSKLGDYWTGSGGGGEAGDDGFGGLNEGNPSDTNLC